jgi:hypothetical protein
MLILAHTSFSQTSVDSQILKQPSQLDIIDKARSLLIDAFIQTDREKAQELHWYLSENFDLNNYITLFPEEQILLLAWYGDFKNLLLDIEKVNATYFDARTKVKPVYTHDFSEIIKKRVLQELDIILDNLQASSLTQEEKDFVAIHLHYYLIRENYYGWVRITDENYDAIVHTINAKTRKFVATYPNSDYIKLLRSYELKPSDWGFGFGMSLGYSEKTGTYSNAFKNGAYVDFNVDGTYKKFMATMGFSVGFGGARKNIVVSDNLVLSKDTSANLYNLYLSFGYRFFDDKRFIITPIAGIGTAWIEPGTTDERKENPTLKQFDCSYGLTTNFGVIADIRIGRMKKLRGQDFADPSYFAIRLGYRFSYNNISRNIPTYYNGNLHTITAGINIFIRNTNHVKYK